MAEDSRLTYVTIVRTRVPCSLLEPGDIIELFDPSIGARLSGPDVVLAAVSQGFGVTLTTAHNPPADDGDTRIYVPGRATCVRLRLCVDRRESDREQEVAT